MVFSQVLSFLSCRNSNEEEPKWDSSHVLFFRISHHLYVGIFSSSFEMDNSMSTLSRALCYRNGKEEPKWDRPLDILGILFRILHYQRGRDFILHHEVYHQCNQVSDWILSLDSCQCILITNIFIYTWWQFSFYAWINFKTNMNYTF